MEPDREPPAAGAVTRRKALQFFGFGSGVVSVVGATGLTWRAADGGVFSTGTGSTYNAWGQAGAAAMLPAGTHAVMTSRIGHPTTAALLSPWRAIADVIRP